MNEELEKLILSGNVKKALDLVHEDKLLPVFIPSYKNRYFTIINQLNEVPGEVHLFIYEDDRKNYPKEFPNNVTVHIITKKEFEELDIPWHTIAGKREYMLEYAKKNYFDKVIVIDDDINFVAKYISKEKKIEECDIWDCFKLFLRLSKTYKYGIIGMCFSKGELAHFNWKKIVSFTNPPYGAIILNIKNLKESNLHYAIFCDGIIHEDTGLIIDCNLKDLKTLNYRFACFICNSKKSNDSIASSKDKINLMGMNYYVYYRDYAKISYSNRIYANINWNNIKSKTHIIHDDFHEALYNACKENNLEKVIDLLQNGIKKEFEEW